MEPSRPGISPPRPGRVRLPALGAALLAALLTACATRPPAPPSEPTRDTSAEEIAVGERALGPAVQARGGEWGLDPALTAYVNGVGQAIARVSERPDLAYDFVVINHRLPDTWVLPGGKVAVNRGLLAALSSEAELAAVLAHEVAHVGVRHGSRRLEHQIMLNLGTAAVLAMVGARQEEMVVGPERVGVTLVNRRYDRREELAADRQGMGYMAAAGYDPAAIVGLLERLLDPANAESADWTSGLLASHPVWDERVEAARAALADLPGGGIVGEAPYAEAVAPLVAAGPAYALAEEAEAALVLEDAELALSKAREAAAIEPREAEFASLEAQALILAERWDEAEAAADRAVALEPGYFRPWLMRALARKGRGDAAGARDDLARSTRLLPTATGYLTLGQLDLDADDTESARENLRRAAGARSASAIEAGKMLTRMEIDEAPGRHISVGVGVGRDGFPYLIIENLSPLPLRDLVVSVTLADTGDGPVTTELSFPGPFRPLSRARRVTTYGPVPEAAGIGARAEVIRAAVAE